MWYFTWVLGLAMAILFAVVNGVWHEYTFLSQEHSENGGDNGQDSQGHSAR